MSARLVALGVLAAAVLVAGVYLFHAVRETTTVSAAVPSGHDGKPAEDKPTSTRPSVGASASASAPPEVPDQGDSGPDVADLDVGSGANPKLDAAMDQANKAYDRQDYEDAKSIAGKILAQRPKNTRMLRIMVSASCMEGDGTFAQKYYEMLPKPDRLQMKQRCDRNGITFTEPAQ